ncbi:MAG: AarF/UbiB family protein, partial [bacterium]|nr:AarF/UbiB family protein [bacterium]
MSRFTEYWHKNFRNVLRLYFFLVVLGGSAVLDAGGQSLVLPEYPAPKLEKLLALEDAAGGPIFRNFLAESVYAASVSRGESARRPESVARLKKVFTRYPDVIGWLNGGLGRAVVEAELEGLLGNGAVLQTGIDSLLSVYLDVEAIARRAGAQSGVENLLVPGVDLFQQPALRYLALSVLERVYRDAEQGRRMEMIEWAMRDHLFEGMVDEINRRLSPEAGLFEISALIDFHTVTKGMPEEYAGLMDGLLPRYFSEFGDRHLLVISYLMAEPAHRTSALFQAAGPALQKLFQMVSDYCLDPAVKKQLGELKSGVRSFGEEDVKEMTESLLRRSVADSIYSVLEVVYPALGSGTIAQAHRVIWKDRSRRRPFVIKVKRPGLQEAIEREMAVIDEVATGPFARKLLRDLRATLARETNLGNEVVEVRTAAAAYKHPRVQVVGLAEVVIPSDSLVAFSFVPGRTLDRINEKVEAVDALVTAGKYPVNRMVADHYMANLLSVQSRAVQELLKLWFDEAIFGGGFFHGDLHAGNIFLDMEEGRGRFEERFLESYRLTLIDFGNTGHFRREQQRGVL